jgi:hypothetical protein
MNDIVNTTEVMRIWQAMGLIGCRVMSLAIIIIEDRLKLP